MSHMYKTNAIGVGKIPINFAPREWLLSVRGVSAKAADCILDVREHMSITRDFLNCLPLIDKSAVDAFDFSQTKSKSKLSEVGQGEPKHIESEYDQNWRSSKPSKFSPRKGRDKGRRYSDLPYPPSTNSEFSTGPGRKNSAQPYSDHQGVKLPKSLAFDGRGRWVTFMHEFKAFIRLNEIHGLEHKLHFLSLALTDKAADYFAKIMRKQRFSDMGDVYDMLAERFRDRELAQSARIQLYNAEQSETEDVEDWADHLWELAYQAFPKASHEDIEPHVVHCFVHGLWDQDAAQYLLSLKLTSMRAAIKRYHKFVYSNTVVYGSRRSGQDEDRSHKKRRVCSKREYSSPNSESLSSLEELEQSVKQVSVKPSVSPTSQSTPGDTLERTQSHLDKQVSLNLRSCNPKKEGDALERIESHLDKSSQLTAVQTEVFKSHMANLSNMNKMQIFQEPPSQKDADNANKMQTLQELTLKKDGSESPLRYMNIYGPPPDINAPDCTNAPNTETVISGPPPRNVGISLSSPQLIQSPERTEKSSVPLLDFAMPPADEENFVCITLLHSKSSLKVKCCVEEVPVHAVLDATADVTIISEELYQQLPTYPCCIKQVKLCVAGEDQVYVAKQIGPVQLKLGKYVLPRILYVAPVSYDMLLGTDVLRALNAKVNIAEGNPRRSDQTISFTCAQANPTGSVTQRSNRVWDPGTCQ